jgi:hypothetical protein
MSKVLPFKPRRTEADVHHLATAILKYLSEAEGLNARLLVTAFNAEHAELRLPDLLAGFSFARKVVSTFEKLVVERDLGLDGDTS